MSDLIVDAREFALNAHKGLFRPNKRRELYSVHITEVAKLVLDAGGSYEEVAAAWLHDTIEDTATTLEEIKERFGEKVALIVEGLTDLPDIATFPTLKRKLLQAERVAEKNDSVKMVKIADGISNLNSVRIDPPVEWDDQTKLDYIIGCGVVARMCHRVSRDLDSSFYAAYNGALARYW